jgi:hypothetical protein
LLLILLLQAGGMLLIYKVQQFTIQYEMRLALNSDESSFEKLILNIAEYRKSRVNSTEIYLNGNLYDVKSVIITGDTAELIVINDLKEKILLDSLKDFLKKSNQSKKELPDQLQKLLAINYIATDPGRIIFIPSHCFNIIYHAELAIYSEPSDIPSPPPKLS